jgi:hypothetical protein
MLSSSVVVGLFQITSDSRFVVFNSGALLSVPVDGSGAPLVISGSPAGPDPSTDYELSPDGRRVVYGAHTYTLDGDSIYWIFSAPVDGSSSPVSLFSPVLEAPFFAAPVFRISPDSRWVVYRSDPDGQPRELLSAPIDGSAAPVRLNDPGSGIYHNFRITRSGQVVFGFTPVGVPAGIYVVPVDRSTGPMRLTDTTPFPSPVKWEVSPLDQVVFVGFTGDYELFSVPLDGSRLPVRLSAPMVANGDIYNAGCASFAISPDGTWVVYAADQDSDEVVEAYAVPTDGSQPARKVNRRLVPGGDVYPPSFTPDSARVLYVGDQEEDDTYELFTSWVERPSPSGATPLTPGLGVH